MLSGLRYLFNRNRCYDKTEINQKELEKMVEEGAILLDVRSPQEFEEGHIKNAILIPEYEIREKATKVIPDKSQKIVVYCSTGHRSQRAQKNLQRLGYKKVFNLCNGLENYN